MLFRSLAGATRVEFGGSPAEFSILDDGSLLAIVTEGAQSGPVAVTLPYGATTSARSFAVRASVPDGTTDGLDGAGGGSAVALPVPGDTTDPGSGVGGVTDAIAPPAILRSPTHRTVVAGARTTFVAESDDPGAAVAWEVSTDRGATWTTIAGAVGPSLTLSVLAGWEGRRYRAVFANEAGAAATAAASLGVVSVSALSRTRVRPGWTVTLSGRRLWTVRAVRVDGIAARFVRLADGRVRLVVPRGVSAGRIVLSTVVGTYRVPRRLVIL